MNLKYLVFASGNVHKVEEVAAKLGGIVPLKGLKDIGCVDDIPETAETLEGNAQMKAQYVFRHYGENCFADDTGLEVEALNGAPGVYSARYAGPQKNPSDNIQKLLHELNSVANRRARFRTVICLIVGGREYFFEGIINGTITTTPSGEGGFGYDPVFIPEGESRTFAQMSLEEKNKVSHRGRAMAALKKFLEEQGY
jgi:XTP/dITP diphosphohydrolase